MAATASSSVDGASSSANGGASSASDGGQERATNIELTSLTKRLVAASLIL
jgi:hypothetical protein